jgi:hypothetical protein
MIDLITYKFRYLLPIIYLLSMMMGCALDAYRMHPEFDIRAGSIKDAVLIATDVRMYELSTGGAVILRDDWSKIGRRNLQNAISRDFKKKQCNIKIAEMDAQIENELAKVQTLYRLVRKTMDQHTFGPQQNRAGSNGFNYSLGPLESILKKLNADSMIFVSGYDQVFKDGRKALIDLAIADASGTILYYTVKGTTDGRDLRDPAGTTALVQDLLSSFSRIEG